MYGETPGREEERGLTTKKKLKGVILLTDNREVGSGEKATGKDFRCSGFKCKEANMQRPKSTPSSFRRTSSLGAMRKS